MAPITTPEVLERVESAFRQVFRQPNYTAPFGSELKARLLLYPIDYTILDKDQHGAVAAAARRSGASDAYFAGYGGEDRGWGGTYSHGVVSLSSYDDYRRANAVGTLEHFLFGSDGAWGVVTSDGEYALVGGDRPFIDAVTTALAYDQEATVRAFVADWREAEEAGASVEWVPRLLEHVLGPEQGAQLWPAPR